MGRLLLSLEAMPWLAVKSFDSFSPEDHPKLLHSFLRLLQMFVLYLTNRDGSDVHHLIPR